MRFRVNRVQLRPPRVVPKYIISEEMQDFIRNGDLLKDPSQDLSTMSMGQALKFIWVYVRKHKLQVGSICG